MKERMICKRCHRIRVIKEAGYCEMCLEVLRDAERPKRIREPTDPPIVYITDPVAVASELRASDVPRGLDPDDFTICGEIVDDGETYSCERRSGHSGPHGTS